MVRGLLYRQMFKAVEGALVAVCLLWLGVFVLNHFAMTKEGAASSEEFRGAVEGSFDFAKTGPPGAYSQIMRSGIFGAAAKFDAKVIKPPPPVSTEAKITELPLLLKGTVVAGLLDPLSSATIQHKDPPQHTKTYFIGNEVFDKVYLQEVRTREVILRNERENKLEHLPMLELYQIAANAPPEKPAIRGGRAARPAATRNPMRNTIALDRKDIQQKLIDQYKDISTKVDVREHKDKNGKVIGLTSPNISQIELAKELGLRDNDILTKINNRPIDSADAILEVLSDFSNARTFRLEIIRGGKKQYLNYTLR